jgi:hypothetical protein
VSSTIVGNPVTLSAQVGSDVRQYIATGNVSFFDGTTTIGTAPLDATGTATLVVSSLAAGTHNISSTYSGDAVLQASSGGPLVVMVADYSMQAQPASLTIAGGQSGTTTLSILPIGGSTQTVQLSCGTVPATINCTFTPATVTLDGTNAASVKITVNAHRASATLVTGRHALGVTASFAFGVVLLSFGSRRTRKRILFGLLGIAIVALCGAGCGSSHSPVAQSSVYVLNVTATSSGAAAKTTPLVITVTN